jgi:hypothetical protein
MPLGAAGAALNDPPAEFVEAAERKRKLNPPR